MDSKVAAIAAVPDIGLSQVQPAVPAARGDEPAAASGPGPEDLRLVIEEDPASGTYVYKTINRLTGEVVQQLPREEVLKLRDGLDYAAGSVVRAKA